MCGWHSTYLYINSFFSWGVTVFYLLNLLATSWSMDIGVCVYIMANKWKIKEKKHPWAMLGIPARVFGSPQTQKQLITEQSERG